MLWAEPRGSGQRTRVREASRSTDRNRRNASAARLGRCVRTRWRRCGMRCRDRVGRRAHRGHRGRSDRDHRRAKHRELGRHEDALGVVTRAHRRLLRRICFVIRAVAVRRVGATAGLDHRHRAQLRHRNGERDDDRDHNGRDPGRGAPDVHERIRASSQRGVNADHRVRVRHSDRSMQNDVAWITTPTRRSGRAARSGAAPAAASHGRP